MPFFSVIVPIYKVEKYLDECVQSVLSQTFTDYECILVDDGSPDNCPAICDEYAKKYERIKVIHKENGGLSDARNVGILQASGEYIVLLDSDDKFVDIDTLQNLFNVIQKYKTDVIVNVNWTEFTDNGKIICKNNFDNNILVSSPKEIPNNFKKSNLYMAGWLFIINRKHLMKNNLFFKKGILHEDDHWMPRILFTTQQIAVNHSAFYAYRVEREGSIMSNVSYKKLFDIFAIVDDLLEWSKDEKTYTKEGCKYMLKKAGELCLRPFLNLDKIKCQEKKTHQNICKMILNYQKKLYKYSINPKLSMAIIILGVENTKFLQNIYIKMKNFLKQCFFIKPINNFEKTYEKGKNA